jgi:hypothetical protein
MKLYIANATKQRHEFWYMIPGTSGPRMQPIPPGAQISVSGNLLPEEVDAVVNHHERYGLIRSDGVDKARAFAGLCYAIDKPVPAKTIEKLFVRNQEVLERRAEEKLVAAALANNTVLENKVEQAASDAGRPLPSLGDLEISIAEESVHGDPSKVGFFRDGAKAAGGIRLSRGDVSTPRGGNGRSRGRRAA